MNDATNKLDLAFGFRLIDFQDPLAQTHWLIFDPPEGYEHDDHPPKGPDDQFYVQIFSKKGQDFLTDSRVRGCSHRIIRLDEWPEESRTVITRLWRAVFTLVEKNAKRRASAQRARRKLQVVLSSLLIVSGVLLILLERLGTISLDQFNSAFRIFSYVGAGIVGPLYALWGTRDWDENTDLG